MYMIRPSKNSIKKAKLSQERCLLHEKKAKQAKIERKLESVHMPVENQERDDRAQVTKSHVAHKNIDAQDELKQLL